MQMSELNVTFATKHTFHLPHHPPARESLERVVVLRESLERVVVLRQVKIPHGKARLTGFTESEELKMDVNQLVSNASGSNRDLVAMLEMLSQFAVTNLEVLNERQEDELSIINQVWKESLEIRQHLKLHWVLSSDVQSVPKEL